MTTVFIPCLDTGAAFPDFSWSDYQGGDMIEGWQVAKTITYGSVQLGCEPITLAFLGRDTTPPESGWDASRFQIQAIQVEVSEPNQPHLGFTFLYTEALPAIGEVVPAGYEPISDGENPQMRRIDSEWISDRFQTYLPQADSPIPAIYLVWCKQPVAA